MGKKKKITFGIKTARYFTKTCTKCRDEYPNWFTNCPKCGAAWDELEFQAIKGDEDYLKKTIKIVVKITEEDFDESLKEVQLVFSADNGKNWYQMKMDNKLDYFIAEIAEVPVGSLIIYYIVVFLVNGEKVIENNDGQYFLYKVGLSLEDTEREQPTSRRELTGEFIEDSSAVAKEYSVPKETPHKPEGPSTNIMKTAPSPLPQQIFRPKKKKERKELIPITEINKPDKIFQSKTAYIQPPRTPAEYRAVDNLTIFGKPQTQIDPDLKVCPHCNSKIKKMWSTCPICGKAI